MPDFAVRATTDELMDGDDVSQAEFAACMRDLATVNTLTLARRPTLAFVAAALRAAPDRELTILDVGFGAGDMLRSVAQLCDRRGRAVRLVGIDLNPRSAPVARAATPAGMVVQWVTGDAYEWSEHKRIDLIISSLVTHHMRDADVVRFLRWMEATARVGWLVNDLHRHPLAYHGFRALSAAMRWHPFVRHDGPLSVARAFTRADWQALLPQADVREAQIAWWLPFRYCVERRRGW